MGETANLKLKTFTSTDPVDYTEINSNSQKIDAGVKALDDKVSAIPNFKITTPLKSGQDFNDILEPGLYNSTGTAITSTLINSPVSQNALSLFVKVGIASAYREQYVFAAYDNCIYYRRHVNATDNSWSDWRKLPSVIDNLNSTSTVDALSAKQGKLLNDFQKKIMSAVSANVNIDAETEGTKYITTGATGTLPPGVSTYFLLQTYGNGDDRCQFAEAILDGSLFYRKRQTGVGWSAWVKVLTKGGTVRCSFTHNGWTVDADLDRVGNMLTGEFIVGGKQWKGSAIGSTGLTSYSCTINFPNQDQYVQRPQFFVGRNAHMWLGQVVQQTYSETVYLISPSSLTGLYSVYFMLGNA